MNRGFDYYQHLNDTIFRTARFTYDIPGILLMTRPVKALAGDVL